MVNSSVFAKKKKKNDFLRGWRSPDRLPLDPPLDGIADSTKESYPLPVSVSYRRLTSSLPTAYNRKKIQKMLTEAYKKYSSVRINIHRMRITIQTLAQHPL